jgi:hypothetical protein
MDEFKEYLEKKNLSKNTIYQYTKYLKHYVDAYNEYPTGEQQDVYRNVENLKLKKSKLKVEATSTKSQTLKAVIAYRNSKGLSNDKMVEMYNDVNREARETALENNKIAEETLPSIDEHMKWVDSLYDLEDVEKLRAWVINKLIINKNVRNKDLVAEIVSKTGHLKKMKQDKNYLYVHKNEATYIRNDYKTAKTYGELKSDLDEPKNRIRMIKALRIIQKNTPDRQLVPLTRLNDLSNYIISKTNGLGETKLMKMVLKKKNSLGEASKISANRGTSLSTLQQNYNIKQ